MLLRCLFTVSILAVACCAAAQDNSAKRIKDNALWKAENKVNEKVDRAIDDALDGKLFKKKNKGQRNGDASVDSTNELNTAEAGNTNPQEKPTLKAYSKFDFVPGEKVLYYDDFERVTVGDFPAEYNTNASGEVMTVTGRPGKWLGLTKNGCFIPEQLGALPDNFTLEMNVGILEDPSNNYSGLGFQFNTEKDKMMDYQSAEGSFVMLHPAGGTAAIYVTQPNGDKAMENEFKMPQWDLKTDLNFARLSFWRQGARLRVYVNENKLMDIPRFFNQAVPYYFSFYRNFFYDCTLLMTDIKIAIGTPDTRNKLITEGRFSTTGILFDFQKSSIRPESYQVLKNIAATLQENPTVRVTIVGHTSNDGDAGANLALSKQRAAAVKQALVSEFGIATDRLQTDGKGGAEPADKGSTLEAKANNRRVEFIKL